MCDLVCNTLLQAAVCATQAQGHLWWPTICHNASLRAARLYRFMCVGHTPSNCSCSCKHQLAPPAQQARSHGQLQPMQRCRSLKVKCRDCSPACKLPSTAVRRTPSWLRCATAHPLHRLHFRTEHGNCSTQRSIGNCTTQLTSVC